MEPLFSHRPESEKSSDANDAPPSRVYRLAVPAPRDVAFSAFVGDIHLWWPSNYTGFGEATHVYIEDGIVGEESDTGESQVWGEVVEEEAARSVAFAWTLAWRPDTPTRIRVVFEDAPPTEELPQGGTAVTFTHDGWAAAPEGFAQYEKYSEWPIILGRFAAYFGMAGDSVQTVS